MSSDTYSNGAPEPKARPDYTLPIARTGEQQFAAIVRNRSGESAGEIDMGVRDVTFLHPSEQQDVVNTAYAIYDNLCRQTGLKETYKTADGLKL